MLVDDLGINLRQYNSELADTLIDLEATRKITRRIR